MEEIIPEETHLFYERHNLKRSDYDGNDFEGNQCDLIMNHADDLEYHIPDEHILFIEGIMATKKLIVAVSGKKLVGNYKEAITNYKYTWTKLMRKYNMNMTVKQHIIFNHVEAQCESTGVGLGFTTDQTVETSHHVVHKRFTISNYYVKKIDSVKAGEQLYKGILHVNAYCV